MTVTLSNNQTSYVSAVEAKAYATLRGLTTFTGIDDDVLEQDLLVAMDYLDATYGFKGSISADTQPRAWPRTGVTDKEGRIIASDAIPDAIKNAQIELAIISVNNSKRILASEGDAGVKSVKAGSVSVTFSRDSIPSEAQRFKLVDRLLSQFIDSRLGQTGVSFAGIVRS